MLPSAALFSRKLRTRNAPPVQLTGCGMLILQAVHRYRLLEWRQLLELFGASFNDAKQLAECVDLLYRNAYLEVIPLPLYPGEESKGHIYRLGQAGALLLSGQLSINFPDFQYWGHKDDKHRQQTKVSRDYLSHSIELADIRMAFERAAAQNNYEIESWTDETELKRYGTWPRVQVETSRGERERVPIIPDGHFVLSGRQGRANFLLEHDRSTEDINRKWQRKILGYKVFILSRMFHSQYGITGSTTPLRILTTTPSLARAHNLKAAAEKYGQIEGCPLFLFTPLPELLSNDVLNSPIWLRGGSAGLQSIV